MEEKWSEISVGELGFYTEDAEELEARMAEIEAEVVNLSLHLSLALLAN